MLHDIKPKLTGLKTDENEVPWGNLGPWIVSEELNDVFKLECNDLLSQIKTLKH